MNNRTIYVTLAVSTVLGLMFILLEYYALHGRNPLNRLGYGVFMSVAPALGAFLVLKLTNFFVSWRGVAIVYIALFLLAVVFQALGRVIPIS